MTRAVIEADPASPGSIHKALAAIDAGGLVYLPAGTYCIEETIELPSGVRLIGAGSDVTTIVLAPGSNCHMFTNRAHREGNSDIELRGFLLEGNLPDQHRPPDVEALAFACGGYFKRVTNVVVDDVRAHSIRQTAFHFTACSKVRVRRLGADELGWSGVSTTATDDIVLGDITVTNAGLDVQHSGIHVNGGRGGYVSAVVDGCTGNAIMLDSSFSSLSDYVVRGVGRRSARGLCLRGTHANELINVYVTGEYCDNRKAGVLVSHASHVFVVDATIASNHQAGIVVQGAAGSKHCVVIGCRIGGSPRLIDERQGTRVDYMTANTIVGPSRLPESRVPDVPVPEDVLISGGESLARSRSTARPTPRRLRRVASAVMRRQRGHRRG